MHAAGGPVAKTVPSLTLPSDYPELGYTRHANHTAARFGMDSNASDHTAGVATVQDGTL